LYALGLDDIFRGPRRRDSSLVEAFEKMNTIDANTILATDGNSEVNEAWVGSDKYGNAETPNKWPVAAGITIEQVDRNSRIRSLQQYRHPGAGPLTSRLATHIRWE
jgi:hypothetical protein